MTYAEYNTDDNFKGNSTADELVKIGFNEGKTREDIENSLSPLWKEDKKGNVKKALDKYYNTETPKAEEKKETVIETPKKEEVTEKVTETAPKKETEKEIKQDNKAANRQNADSLTQEQIEYQNQRKNKQQAWDNMLDTADKQREAFSNIDDHMVEQLPTFMIKRYADGEFGDPKSSDAKLRLAHFMLNGVQSKLKSASNAAAIAAGRSPMFTDTTSDYEKYQQSNLAQGLENRWNKYKQDTQAAIDLAKQRGVADEDLNEAIAKISSNNRLQASFNRMNEEQKVFTLQVMSEIGDEMGNMSDEKFFNTLVGFATSGDSLDYKEAAAMLVYRYIKDPDKQQELLDKLGFGDMGGGLFGGLGGALTGGGKDKEDNPETTLEDGTNVDAGKVMSNADYEKITKAAEDLGNKYYNGEIDEAKFRSEYAKLEAEMKKHGVYSKFKNIKSQDDYIKQIAKNKRIELSGKLDELNNDAKNLSKDDYLKKYEDLKAQAEKWGASAKELKSMESDKNKYVKKTKK